MAHFRLEALFDVEAQAYYVEIFYPPESTVPLIRTKSKFPTKDAALSETMVTVGDAFQKQPEPGAAS